MTITEDEAWKIFANDIAAFRKQALPLVKVALKQHQFDALASFVYNIGPTAFATSTMLKRLNAGDFDDAASELLRWNKPSEIQSRRRGEFEQFTKGTYVARVT
jgi:lysozyme